MDRAPADRKFLLKFLLIAIALMCYLLYCLYDGVYTYPKELERSKAFAELTSKVTDETEIDEQWKKITTEKKWKQLPVPVPPAEQQWKVYEQFIQAGLCALIAIPLLLWYLKKRSGWVESDGKSLTSSWGQSFQYKDVVSIDKKKWEKKGIAMISYNDGGDTKQFKIDDLAFERKTVDKIVWDLEQFVGTDKIVNGDPEKDPAIVAEEARQKALEREQRMAMDDDE